MSRIQDHRLIHLVQEAAGQQVRRPSEAEGGEEGGPEDELRGEIVAMTFVERILTSFTGGGGPERLRRGGRERVRGYSQQET